MQDVMIDTAAQAATNYAAYEAVHAATAELASPIVPDLAANAAANAAAAAGPKLKKILDVYEGNKPIFGLAAAVGAAMLPDPAPATETVVVIVESGAAALAADPVAIGEAVAEAADQSAEGLAELATLAAEAGVVTVMATAAGLALPVLLGTAGLVCFGCAGYTAWKNKGFSVRQVGDLIKAEWDAVNVEVEEIPNVDWEALAQECNSNHEDDFPSNLHWR